MRRIVTGKDKKIWGRLQGRFIRRRNIIKKYNGALKDTGFDRAHDYIAL
jgi:hypothetical protein